VHLVRELERADRFLLVPLLQLLRAALEEFRPHGAALALDLVCIRGVHLQRLHERGVGGQIVAKPRLRLAELQVQLRVLRRALQPLADLVESLLELRAATLRRLLDHRQPEVLLRVTCFARVLLRFERCGQKQCRGDESKGQPAVPIHEASQNWNWSIRLNRLAHKDV
jgi:hypothetical protein